VINGLTIINGLVSDVSSGLVGGGAILCDATSPQIKNCILRDNTAGAKEAVAPLKDGGAIECINGSEPFISSNRIESNWANHTGAGIHFNNSSGRVENNFITDNISLGCYGGGGISLLLLSDPEIVNNLIAYNHAEYYGDGGYGAGIICMNSGPSIVNNTIVYNSTATDLSDGEGGGIRIRGTPYPVLVNNILWYNTSSPGLENLDFQYPTEILDIQYCNLEGGLGTVQSYNPATIINSVPDFTNTAIRDFSLLVSSQCIDNGIVDLSLYPFSFFDLAHNSRISGTTIDIGAYEYQF
jgi:hypothetical protein